LPNCIPSRPCDGAESDGGGGCGGASETGPDAESLVISQSCPFKVRTAVGDSQQEQSRSADSKYDVTPLNGWLSQILPTNVDSQKSFRLGFGSP
jgi:hypothetical protein